MWSLLKQNMFHIIRTRLLLVLLAFSFVIQFAGMRTLHFLTFRFQGIVSAIGAHDAIYVALFLQLFTGAFIAAAYGIWMVPYAHQGVRSSLTFTLPVSKWLFPLSYALSMLVLLLLQHFVMLLSFGLNAGFAEFQSAGFPWMGLGMALLLQTLAFEVFMFAFALCSMIVGQIPTFFLGAMTVLMLQLAGAIFRIDFETVVPNGAASVTSSLHWTHLVYSGLPPVGELAFDLRKVFLKPDWSHAHFQLWVLWFVILVALFRLKIRYPNRVRAGEA